MGCSPGPAGKDAPLLADVTAASGIPEPAGAWPDGRYRIHEITASGLALFDADGDGDLDALVVCHPPPGNPDAPAPDRLFRNGSGMRFEEVPGAAGLADPGHGNGAAVGDVENDGDLDVFVCNLGKDSLYRNAGDGSFANATGGSGIDENGWTSGAAFLDYDRDGDLDLYVVHYVVDDPTRICRPGRDEKQEYCGPARYESVADALYRNEGEAKFTDVSRAAGIVVPRAGLAVACLDLTSDGWVDILVANDRQPNLLYVNRTDGTFVDEGMERGVALSGGGDTEASMGIAPGDVNADGRLDLLVTALERETATLYLGADGGAFVDRSAPAGLGGSTLARTSWGACFLDLENDGDLDLALTNGRIARGPAPPGVNLGAFWNEYAETNQLFLNDGKGRFSEAVKQGGGFTAEPGTWRALAAGDLDGDGDVDLAAADLANRLRLFRNDAPRHHHWLRVRAVTGKRDALGATVAIESDGRRQVRPILAASSYASSSEPIAHFGLGNAAAASSVEVTWPDGKTERFAVPEIDRTITVRQGEGRVGATLK